MSRFNLSALAVRERAVTLFLLIAVLPVCLFTAGVHAIRVLLLPAPLLVARLSSNFRSGCSTARGCHRLALGSWAASTCNSSCRCSRTLSTEGRWTLSTNDTTQIKAASSKLNRA